VRILFVWNPASGSSGNSDPRAIEAALRRLGTVETLETSSREQVPIEVAEAATDVDLVAVAGGDGTIGDVVNAVDDRLDGLLFALLPTGTGNDLAGTLGLPNDALACAAALDPHMLRSIDVGRISGADGERLFVNGCLGGFPVDVDEAIGEDHKRRLGPLAFWVGGLKAAADLQRATVRVDGREVPDCVAVGVGNGRSAGGGIEVWPEADPSDGLLDVCALGAPGALGAARVALGVVRAAHGDLDAVHVVRAERVRIEADPQLDFNVDGELAGFSTPVEFGVAGAVRIVLCG
jgi:diacylglycerol kinase (ATP)